MSDTKLGGALGRLAEKRKAARMLKVLPVHRLMAYWLALHADDFALMSDDRRILREVWYGSSMTQLQERRVRGLYEWHRHSKYKPWRTG